jgi:hypothetical protein
MTYVGAALVERTKLGRVPWEAFPGIFMNNIIYIIGLVVVVVAVLGFFGLRT